MHHVTFHECFSKERALIDSIHFPPHQEKVSELSAEKEALNEKLKAEEERRKQILGDKSLVRTSIKLLNSAMGTVLLSL